MSQVHSLRSNDFSGLGLIVSADPATLPTLSLRPHTVIDVSQSVKRYLAKVSSDAHELHDGFHVLSPSFEVLAVAQYFSPPIVPSVLIDPHRKPGGRHVAALFGSCLPSIILTGVVGRGGDLSIFRDGEEILRENLA